MKARRRHVALIIAGLVLAVVGGIGSAVASSYAAQASPLPTVVTPPSERANGAWLLLDVSGVGAGDTPVFTTGQHWTMTYVSDCRGQVDYHVEIEMWDPYNQENAQDILANTHAEVSRDTVHEQYTGAHHFSVDTSCAWAIKVWADQ